MLDISIFHISKTGVISMEGRGNGGVIRRDVYFTWEKSSNNYILTSSEVEIINAINTITNDELTKIMPGFYLFPGKKYGYTIKKQSNGGLIFYIGDRPVFFL